MMLQLQIRLIHFGSVGSKLYCTLLPYGFELQCFLRLFMFNPLIEVRALIMLFPQEVACRWLSNLNQYQVQHIKKEVIHPTIYYKISNIVYLLCHIQLTRRLFTFAPVLHVVDLLG